MKIGQFTDTFLPVVDGVGRVAYNYAEQIAQKGHECYVIAPMCDTGFRGKYPFEIVDYAAKSFPGLPQYRFGTPELDTHYLDRIKMIQFDIVHTHTPFIAGAEAKRTAKKLGIPLVGSFHSKYYDDFYKLTHLRSAAEFGTDIVVHFFNECDDVWAVSSASADVLHDYGYKGEIFVVENGVAITEPIEDDALRAQELYGFGDLPVILFVGQMNWKKNILTLLEAAALLKKRGVKFKLALAGQGPDLDEIKQKVKELSLDEEAVFAGHITDGRLLNGLYLRSAIFAFLSEYDNAPMVVREAAVMKTPSLLVRGSSAAEVLIDGFNGLLCENSAEDAADKLAGVINYPNDLAKLGQNARNTIPIGWSGIIDRALQRYEEIIARTKNK